MSRESYTAKILLYGALGGFSLTTCVWSLVHNDYRQKTQQKIDMLETKRDTLEKERNSLTQKLIEILPSNQPTSRPISNH